MENTILVSTMWDRATGSTSKYEQNEEQLRNDFWKIFLAGGATMTRSKNSEESSQTILRHLLDKLPAIPQMQHELGAEGRNLGDTTAGEELRAETIEMQKKFDEQLAAAKEEYRRALDENNKKMQKMLQEECAKYEHKIQNIESELEILKANRK
jgi:protein subunit release factor A